MTPEQIAPTLIEIWRNLLKLDHITLDDDFLDLGGDSMLALRLRSRVEDHYGFELPAQVLFECSTVRQLAAAVSDLIETQGG